MPEPEAGCPNDKTVCGCEETCQQFATRVFGEPRSEHGLKVTTACTPEDCRNGYVDDPESCTFGVEVCCARHGHRECCKPRSEPPPAPCRCPDGEHFLTCPHHEHASAVCRHGNCALCTDSPSCECPCHQERLKVTTAVTSERVAAALYGASNDPTLSPEAGAALSVMGDNMLNGSWVTFIPEEERLCACGHPMSKHGANGQGTEIVCSAPGGGNCRCGWDDDGSVSRSEGRFVSPCPECSDKQIRCRKCQPSIEERVEADGAKPCPECRRLVCGHEILRLRAMLREALSWRGSEDGLQAQGDNDA